MHEEGYIAVVGAANVDISGEPYAALIMGDSNPGRVSVTLGGVGRNIAENLIRLGFDVSLITALGGDAYADGIRRSCAELGLDISHSLSVPDARTSTYVCVNDGSGELVAAVNDMAIYDMLDPDFLRDNTSLLDGARLIILDANLPRDSIEFIARNCAPPIIADPVSVKKSERLSGVIDRLTLIKPNRREASLLTGVSINTDADLCVAANAFFKLGLSNVLISLGERGVYYNDGRDSGILPCVRMPIVNTTGCGDAFLAAAAAGYLCGDSLCDIARMGLAASAICAGADSAVSPDISMSVIR